MCSSNDLCCQAAPGESKSKGSSEFQVWKRKLHKSLPHVDASCASKHCWLQYHLSNWSKFSYINIRFDRIVAWPDCQGQNLPWYMEKSCMGLPIKYFSFARRLLHGADGACGTPKSNYILSQALNRPLSMIGFVNLQMICRYPHQFQKQPFDWVQGVLLSHLTAWSQYKKARDACEARLHPPLLLCHWLLVSQQFAKKEHQSPNCPHKTWGQVLSQPMPVPHSGEKEKQSTKPCFKSKNITLHIKYVCNVLDIVVAAPLQTLQTAQHNRDLSTIHCRSHSSIRD